MLWTLVRVFGLEAGFPLVPLMAFTPYAAIAALLVAGVATALRNWAAAAVAGLATLCLAIAVLPRAVGDGTVEAAGRETFTVLSANIHHGTAEAEALVDLVDRYEPDLLAIQELTPGFDRRLRLAGLDRQLPNEVLETRRGVSGSGIYSSLPMRKLTAPQVFAFRQPRAVLRLPDGRRFRVVDVHPYPPQSHHVEQWTAALESLPATGEGVPWVLVGDFNATLDHSLLREILDRGYRDAGDVAGEGLEPTWPADDWASRAPGVTIDHVLADERLGVVDYEVEELPGSDHRAVFAELAMP
ncbi:MAG: endonuclease/exonuclease/phosphatase family protein [Actinomycetota bacterium]|nr:endonuclease/exonuclease/phosphatase family protein [Actinomycetota bacterium]